MTSLESVVTKIAITHFKIQSFLNDYLGDRSCLFIIKLRKSQQFHLHVLVAYTYVLKCRLLIYEGGIEYWMVIVVSTLEPTRSNAQWKKTLLTNMIHVEKLKTYGAPVMGIPTF